MALRLADFMSQLPMVQIQFWINTHIKKKLDGIGPVDNKPSTDKLHHFVQKKWHVTRDMWHVKHDMWHLTHDTFWGVHILSKFQLPSLPFVIYDIMKIWRNRMT